MAVTKSVKFEKRVDIITIDQFLQRITVKYAEELAVQYNQRLKVLTVTDMGTEGTYVRKVAYLKKSFHKNVAKMLAVHPVTYEIALPCTSQEAIEAMTVASLEQFGTPDCAVIVGKYLCVLNPKDFSILLKFDVFGQLFGTVVCYNRAGNFKTDATTGKIQFEIPALNPEEIAKLDATLNEVADAVKKAKNL